MARAAGPELDWETIMNKRTLLGIAVLLTALVSVSGCGTNDTAAFGNIVVLTITDPIDACTASNVVLTGINFLSEHGDGLIIRFEATVGEPFMVDGMPSAVIEVPGTAITNEHIDFLSPIALNSVSCTITIILPGGASGSSALGQANLVAGQQGPPLALNDDYSNLLLVIGNVLLDSATSSVLDNDIPAGCRPEPSKPGAGGVPARLVGHTIARYDATTAMGGDVVMNMTDGTFTYNPPVGYEGPDTFTYEMTDGNVVSNTATVTLFVEEMVWFVDDTAPPGGDGRFTDPLDSLFAFDNLQPPVDVGVDDLPQNDDTIFIYRGTGNTYDGGVRLLDGQRLYGEGTELNFFATIIVPEGLRPTITNSGIAIGVTAGVDCVILASGNRVTGLNIDMVPGNGIAGFGIAGPTLIDRVDITAVQGSGIWLREISGTHQIGDPAAGLTPCVVIDGAGFAGIDLDNFGQTPDLRAAVLGGIVEVVDTDINDAFVGITAQHVDLFVDRTQIGMETAMVTNGIQYFNSSNVACSLTVTNTNIFNVAGTPGANGDGIQVQGFGLGLTTVTIAMVNIHASNEALDIQNFAFGQGATLMNVAVDSCGLQRTTAGYTVVVSGFDSDATAITQFREPFVIGNGSAQGLFFEGLTFDADGDVSNGVTQVDGDRWRVGDGAAGRVLGTASFFGESVNGDLLIDTYDVFQTAGNASGIDNLGLVTITVTTSNVDNVP